MKPRFIRNVPDYARNLSAKAVPVPANTVVKVTTDGLHDRQLVIIRNIGKDTVYLGSSDVNDTNGFPLFVNEVIVLSSKKDVFAYSKKDGELRVLEG